MKIKVPQIAYYDQDFIEIYKQTWQEIQNCCIPSPDDPKQYLFHRPDSKTINQFETILCSFALVYQSRPQSTLHQIDMFYKSQEENGAIRADLNFETQETVPNPDNPEGLNPPLFAWLEYNLYHKIGIKKRIQEVFPVLERYFHWVDTTFRDPESGLLASPLEAMNIYHSPRKADEAHFLIDLNAQQLINAYYMAQLGDILNDKNLSFRYHRYFFSLKTRVIKQMWNPETEFFYDLTKEGRQIPSATLSSYWLLLADIMSNHQQEKMIEKLRDPEWFLSENPFPSLAQKHPQFSPEGYGHYGAVFPDLNFAVIKGLETYQHYALAREYAIKHIYHIIDTYHQSEEGPRNMLWQAYKPYQNQPGFLAPSKPAPAHSFQSVSLHTVTILIETIIGLNISLPRKTVNWTSPSLEEMGIRNLALRRNMISILTHKTVGGWEIRLESEKLYYFTVDIIDYKKKTLPIPSGKCSILIEKL